MTRLPVLTALTAGLLITSAASAAQSTPQFAINQANTTLESSITSVAPGTDFLKTEKEKVSYSIGADLGENFKEQGIPIDPAVLVRGLKDALQGKVLLKQETMANILKTFQQELTSKKQMEFKQLSLKNKQEGDTYLTHYREKTGVKRTDSGLEYEVIKPGYGKSPTDQATVTAEYIGRFVDGKIFDQSKQPVTFSITQVIPGWTEILKLMKPGATFKVAIPPKLAYGEQGIDKVIGPNKTLLFTIHLVDVKNK